MVEQAIEKIMIAASPQRCFEAAIDFKKYPLWARDIKNIEILNHDDSGRAVDVEYTAAAMGRSIAYTLSYSYASDPLRLTWKLKKGDAVTHLEGGYKFESASDAEDDSEDSSGAAYEFNGEVTEVSYYLAVELAVSLPSFAKRRVEDRIMHTALDELKHYVETSAANSG